MYSSCRRRHSRRRRRQSKRERDGHRTTAHSILRIKMANSSREMKRLRESSLRLRRHHHRREGAPFCAPLFLFVLFVLRASSLNSFFVSSCVPTIRCPNGEDVVTTIRTCRAEWRCTWSAIAPKTNSPKRFSLLHGLADILNIDSEELQRSAFNMTNVKGHSVLQYSMTIQPSCSRVGCDLTKTSITLNARRER